ncbi:MAG: response regulator transcription factor [bacterium]
MANIVIVEDDAAIAEMLVFHLQDMGHQVHHIADGLQAQHDLLNHTNYQLVVLDVMLPNYSGLDLCRELRQQHAAIPIIMLTSLDSEIDRVLGLEFGADDYVTKPFSMREFQARVKALLRRSQLSSSVEPPAADEPTMSETLSFDELVIHIAQRDVYLAGKALDLTAKEFDLLVYLARHTGKVFSRAQLLNEVWDYHYNGYEHTVNTHINRLRNKLKRADSKPDFIQTAWGVGYKFSNG